MNYTTYNPNTGEIIGLYTIDDPNAVDINLSGKSFVEGKFNKILDALFEKLSLSKKETDQVRFSNRMDQLSGEDGTRKLENEKIFLMRKIDEVQSEIFQLENNIQFFAKAKKDNPMVLEVMKNIDRQRENLDGLKDKLKQIRNYKKEE